MFSLTSRIKRLANREEGQALVLVCVGLLFILLMAGLGVDIGYLRYQKHQMQKAADAGAMAGASVLAYSNDDARITNAAIKDAKANGFEHGTNNIVVTVNHPPESGPFNGDSHYVEVYVEQPRPTFFMKVMGHTSANVRARAVGSAVTSASGCIYVLDPHGSGALTVNGGVNVNAACGIYINSDSGSALRMNGTSGCMQSSGSGNGIGVVGGDNQGSGRCANGMRFAPDPTNGIAPISDPFSKLQPPSTTGPCLKTNYTVKNGDKLQPGKYCGGITINGGSGNVNFPKGVYILYGGGLTVTGTPTITGTGVTFYNTGAGATGTNKYAPIKIAGSSTSVLSAPTDPDDAFAGILFFQDRNYKSTNPTDESSITGSNGAKFVGAMYFPGTDLKYSGTPGLDSDTVLVAYRMTFSGDTTITDHFLDDEGSPLKSAALAE